MGATTTTSLITQSKTMTRSVYQKHKAMDLNIEIPRTESWPPVFQGKELTIADPELGRVEHGNATKAMQDECCIADDSMRKEISKLCFGASGIYAAYLYYGHVQEDVFSFEAPDGSKFHSAWLVQVLESLANIMVGLIARRYWGGGSGFSLSPFFTTGAAQLFAKTLTSLSLAAGLSFPVCTLAKCAKIVPVMLGQLMLGGSTYTFKDYLYAAAIVGGTALLTVGESNKKSHSSSTSTVGVILILISLCMDGLTAGLQKRLKRETSKAEKPPTTYDFLLYTNLSMAVVAFVISTVTNDWFDGWLFMIRNPEIQHMVAITCMCSAVGQSFVFYVVRQFDPQVCATVTTTRKILSVVWSIVMKGHIISSQGVCGLALACVGVLLELRAKLSHKKDEPEQSASRSK